VTSRAQIVCALARLTFTAAGFTLRHDPDPTRKRDAIANALAAVDGLIIVCRVLRTAAAGDCLAEVAP
jgi:hypothetical protein